MNVEMKEMTVPFELKEQSDDSDFFTFAGIASSFGNIDHDNDRMNKGAFDGVISRMRQDENFTLPVLWQHDRNMPIGVYIEIRETDSGLWVKAKLPKDDDFVKGRVMPQLKIGSINKMSIGFILKDWERDSKGIRDIREADLKEISLVTFPADEHADITEIKSVVPYQDLPLADRGTAWDSGAARRRIASWAGVESPSDLQSSSKQSRYRRAFLWYDRERSEFLGSYKMPIATIVNGRLSAVPRAIFAAAAVMRGARGGVDIPSGDRSGIISHLNRYYKKMGMDSPFSDKAFRIDDFSVLSERSLEHMLMDGVSFSKKTTRQLISGLKDVGLWEAAEARRDGEEVEPENFVDLEEKLDEILRSMKNGRTIRNHGKSRRSGRADPVSPGEERRPSETV